MRIRAGRFFEASREEKGKNDSRVGNRMYARFERSNSKEKGKKGDFGARSDRQSAVSVAAK